jgi:hypothetical protein
VTLPSQDILRDDLVGLEQVRVYFLPLGNAQPSAEDLLTKGEVIMETRTPDLPRPGKTLLLDMSGVTRPAGWIIVISVRVGDVLGAPSEILPWLDPVI